MNIGELGTTVAIYGLPIKVVVLNNRGDGIVKQWQKLFFKGRFSASYKSTPSILSGRRSPMDRICRAVRPQDRCTAQYRGVHPL
jgi:hypothetical protein